MDTENTNNIPTIEIDSFDEDLHASGSDRQHQIMPAIAATIIIITNL